MFFSNQPATTEIYTLSLHDALPIFDAFERVELLRDLREGRFEALIGVNLLREGLDLPEVSMVAILDADKEGFLRSRSEEHTSELQSQSNLVCRLLLEKKKKTYKSEL